MVDRKLAVAAGVCLAAFGGWQLCDRSIHPGVVEAATSNLIRLGEAKRLEVRHQGSNAIVSAFGAGATQPLSLVSEDFDRDGVSDLAVGYATADGGRIAILRGNLDAFAPQSEESFQAIGRGEFPSPFLTDSRTLRVPVRPDFIAAGNLIAGGFRDLVIGSKGGHTMYVLAGNGKGGFATPQPVELPGVATALAVGPFGRSSEFDSLIVGVSNGNSSALLVYTPTHDGLGTPATYPLRGAVTNIALGNLQGRGTDAVVVSGGEVSILHSASGELQPLSLPITAVGLALGSFVTDRYPGLQMALLASDGSVQIAVHGQFDPRTFTVDELKAIRLARRNGRPHPFLPSSVPDRGWMIVEGFSSIAPPSDDAPPVLLRTRISSRALDDIMVLNSFAGQMTVISHPDPKTGDTTFTRGEIAVRPLAGPVVAALPVRVNVDARPGVVALSKGELRPAVMAPLPDPTFNVNTTSDTLTANACANATPNACSLREAIVEVNAATTPAVYNIMVPNGTYTLTRARSAGVYDGSTGMLAVGPANQTAVTVNIIGSGQATTIIQAGTTGVNPGPPNGVDKVFAFNQDVTVFTNATVSVSNLTIQNGFNRGDEGGFDGDGGAFEFDTGANATATLTVMNVTLTNNTLTEGQGAGFAIFNTNDGSGVTATFSNCTISDNVNQPSTANGIAGNGGGGFLDDASSMTMTGSTVTQNMVNTNPSQPGATAPVGGGIRIQGAGGSAITQGTTQIHSTTISNNTAASDGGGIWNAAKLTVDQGSVISGNTSGNNGGGIFDNSSSPFSSSLSKVKIIQNSATANGGGVFHGDNGGALTISFSRFASNTAPSGTANNLTSDTGSVTATNNWWGTNAPHATISSLNSGSTTFDPFIVLTHTGSAQKIRINQPSTLTADMSKDNHGNGAALSGNLDEIVGLPVTFDGAVLGVIPQAQPETLGNPVPTATATFNAGGTSGFGTANATVDAAVVPVNSNLIASATESGTTATITTVGAHGFSSGEYVRISGVSVAGYNSSPATQVFKIAVTGATTFTYTANSSSLGAASTGTVNAAIDVLQPPSITKTFSPKTIQTTGGLGTTASTITFSLTNPNVIPVDSSFTDNLPANVGTVPGSLVVASTPNVVNTCGPTATASAGSGTISYANSSLPIGTCSVKVDVQSAVDNIYSNSVTLDSSDAGNGNTASDTLNVINPPHISKAFDQSSIPFGATTGLTITVSNPNQNQTLSAISFTDTLPSNAPGTLAGASTASTTCTGTAGGSAGSTSVSLSGASLAPGASCMVSISVKGTKAGAANNSVTVSDTTAGTGNNGTASETVTPATTTTAVTSDSNPSVFGQSVAFTATVTNTSAGSTGSPTGTVQFVVDGSNFGPAVALTSATSTTSTATSQATAVIPVTGSPHTVSVNYVNTDGNFSNSSGSLSPGQSVTAANVSVGVVSSTNPSVFGQSVTFTATVTDTSAGSIAQPTGSIQFAVDGVNVGMPVTLTGATSTSSTATSSAITNIPVTGSPHTVSASYVNTDANFSNNSGSLAAGQTVNRAATSTGVTSSQNPAVFGTSITFTATVTNTSTSPAPTGSVQFVVDGSNFGSPVSLTVGGGNTSTATSGATTTLSVQGSPHTVTAIYQNSDGNFSTSNGSLAGGQQITQIPTTTTVSPSQGTITLGDTVTFTATVSASSGTPTGLVTFFDGNTPLGSATLNGVPGNDQASITTSLLSAAGSPHSITAVHQSSGSFAPSTSASISETVNLRTSTTGLVLNPTTVVVGQSSTATVTVTDSGSVPPGTPDTFQTTGAPTPGRTGFTSTLFADGMVLVAGGTDANNNVLNSAQIYSISGGAFTATGNLNAARTGARAVLLRTGMVLVAGGSSNGTAAGAINTAELFDPVAGTFTTTSHLMTAARFGFTATLLNSGKVLLTGGANSGGVLNSAELYDPATDTFTATGNLNTARTGASAKLLGTGKVLVAGGSSDGTANGALNSAEVFDPAGNAGAGTFTAIIGANSTLAAGRWQPEAALLLSGKVLVAGGQNSGGALTSADLYDPVANTFTPSTHQMAQARANGSAILLPSGMVLLAGGTTSQAVDLYDADSDTFDSTGSLQQSDSGLVSTLLNNGQVLVVGLTTAATPASDAGLYSPSFNPLGTVAVTSSEATDGITGACTLTPSTSTASTCTSTVTPVNVATSPHTITGAYPADAAHSGSNNTASLTVNQANTTTAVTSSANPSVFGQSVTFTATVSAVAPGSGSPTGTVTFLDAGNPIGTGTLSGGVATFTTSVLAVGNHTITTTYPGNSNYNSSMGSLTGNPQVVNKSDTTTTLTSSANPSVFGQSVTFTATVSAAGLGSGTPTGTVTFLDGGNSIGTGTLSGGVATFTTSALAVGNHTITTSYGGDGNFNSSNGSLTGNPQVVSTDGTSTTVTSSVNPSVFGQSVTFTATVSAAGPGSGTPTGTVTFLDGGGSIGTGTLSGGVATFSTAALSVASHTITTSYGGDANFNTSAGSLTGNPQVVGRANTTTAVTSSLNASTFGQSVTFTATVAAASPGAGTPTGTVTFQDAGGSIGTGTLSSGMATFTTSTLSAGNHTITAIYGGDGNFLSSIGPLTGNPQVVNKTNSTTALTSSANPSVFGQSVTFTATISAVAPGGGTATGTVTFLDGGGSIGTGTLSGGVATFTTSGLSVSSHTITTTYLGDGNFNGSSGSLTGNPQVVNKANTATAVSSSANPSSFGQTVTFTATVSAVGLGAGTPTGTVTFLDGGGSIGTGTLSGGVATFSTSALGVANHTITTSYNGDGNFNGSAGSLTGNPQVVNKAGTMTTVTSSLNPAAFGQSITFTATVTVVLPGVGTPSGTVTFLDGSNTIGTGTLSGGVATFTTTTLAPGSRTFGGLRWQRNLQRQHRVIDRESGGCDRAALGCQGVLTAQHCGERNERVDDHADESEREHGGAAGGGVYGQLPREHGGGESQRIIEHVRRHGDGNGRFNGRFSERRHTCTQQFMYRHG